MRGLVIIALLITISPAPATACIGGECWQVVQQPNGDSMYVAPEGLTQYHPGGDVTWLMAHDYTPAGQAIMALEIGDTFEVAGHEYHVAEISHYRDFAPPELLSASVVLQTCEGDEVRIVIGR